MALLKTLVTVGYDGLIYLYLLSRAGEDTSWTIEFQQQLSKAPLSITFIEYEVPEWYGKRNTIVLERLKNPMHV